MQQIPVFSLSDNNYAPYLCATLYSVLENTSEYINFYILGNGISEESKKKIDDSLKCFNNFSLKYCDLSKCDISRFPDAGKYSINTFLRMFIPELEPELNKIVCIDSDTIVKGDIAELYNVDLEDKLIGATSENFYELNGKILKKRFAPNFCDTKDYFNAGILVMNVEKIKKLKMIDKCIDKMFELGNDLHCADQDVLNIVFEHKVKFIDQKFDYMPDHYKYYRKFYGKKEAENLKNRAVILHYTVRKPWYNLSCADEDFWNIVNKTSFKDDLLNNLDKFNKKNRFNLTVLRKRLFK